MKNRILKPHDQAELLDIWNLLDDTAETRELTYPEIRMLRWIKSYAQQLLMSEEKRAEYRARRWQGSEQT